MLFLAPRAEAAITSLFNDQATPVSCAVQSGGNAGERHCSGIFTTFDGAPIDVNIGFPPAPASGPDGDFPIIGVFHGWGGAKLGLTTADMQEWLDEGYAVFSMSDRGWGNSCGGTDPKRLQPVCANGYNHLMDTRFEVRDAQEVFAALADQVADGATAGEGLIDPQRIGSTGGSYGGGISMALGALKNRKMVKDETSDETLIPWMSDGTETAPPKAMQIAAVQPDIPWTDLAYSLQPNGHTLDYVADAPYLARGRIGVLKQSFVAGLYALGQALSNYAPAGTDPDADLTTWYASVNGGEPYDENPQSQDIVDEITTHHSSYYIEDSTAPAPMLISNGWTDDLFPPDEAIRFYNRTRTNHPGTPIALIFTDHGHQRGQNKPVDATFRNRARHAWFDYYVKGEGPQPFQGVQTLTQTCTEFSGGATGDFNDANVDLPFQAASWSQLAPGEIELFDVEGVAQQVIASSVPSDSQKGQAYDPISGDDPCATVSASDQTGAANYKSAPAPAGGFTLMGAPTILADILSVGPTSQVAARLIDLDPVAQTEMLVARGLYRPLTGTTAACQVFQLHPNGWKFAPGHIVKLELLPADQPYGRNSNGQLPITVANLKLRLPVLEQPDGDLIQAPAPKVLPDGYELAAGVPTDIDTSCPTPPPTTTLPPTTTSLPPTTTSLPPTTLLPTTTTVVTPTTTTTTTTTLPVDDLTLRRAKLRAQSTRGPTGRISVQGTFTTPPNFSPPFTVRVHDAGSTDRSHVFQDCDTSGTGVIRCRETSVEGVFKAKLKPTSSGFAFKISFLDQPIDGPFQGPVTVILAHNAAVVRIDSISACTQKPASLSCREP